MQKCSHKMGVKMERCCVCKKFQKEDNLKSNKNVVTGNTDFYCLNCVEKYNEKYLKEVMNTTFKPKEDNRGAYGITLIMVSFGFFISTLFKLNVWLFLSGIITSVAGFILLFIYLNATEAYLQSLTKVLGIHSEVIGLMVKELKEKVNEKQK